MILVMLALALQPPSGHLSAVARRAGIGWTETQAQTIQRLPIGKPRPRK